MKRKRISTYIIVLLTLSSLLGAPVPAIAQQKGDTQKEELPEQPFYQGMTVGMDIFGILGKAFGSDFTSADVSLEANIKNRYFPIVEMGYDTTFSTRNLTCRENCLPGHVWVSVLFHTMWKHLR